MTNDKNTHIIVLVVNILSCNSHQVRSGKVTYDIPNPNIREAHASLVASTAILVPYQKQTLAGIPNIIAAMNGLSFHQSQIYWEYSWNQTAVWAKANRLHDFIISEICNDHLLCSLLVISYVTVFVYHCQVVVFIEDLSSFAKIVKQEHVFCDFRQSLF